MPIDEKEEFDEESQICLWETKSRSSNFASTSMQKQAPSRKDSGLLAGEDSSEGKKRVDQRASLARRQKPKALVTNPILEEEAGGAKQRPNNMVLEEVQNGLMSRFHQEREENNFSHSPGLAPKASQASKPHKNKGGLTRRQRQN